MKEMIPGKSSVLGIMIPMKSTTIPALVMLVTVAGTASCRAVSARGTDDADVRRYLYVASPGLRNYVQWGGKGVIVLDIDNGHKFVRRIPLPFPDVGGRVENIKGICASAATKRLYVSTIQRMACIDLETDKTLWVKQYPGGCDRMAIRPDGKFIYLPSLEKDHWHVVDGATGDVVKRIDFDSPKGAHNTVCPPTGKRVYMAGLRSPILHVVDTSSNEVVGEIGPFSAPVRPFTIAPSRGLAIVCINRLLGFEIGDLKTGRKLHRVQVPGFKPGRVKMHGCPSHGVGVTPDEKEVWVVDAFNQHLHVFDLTVMPPKYKKGIPLKVDQPGWVTFTIRGDYAYSPTGEVVNTKTGKIVTLLKDEEGRHIRSEKMLEVDWSGGRVVSVGDQFGVGRPK